MAATNIKIGVLTVSDRCAEGKYEDTSGPNLIKLLREDSSFGKNASLSYKCVADEIQDIKDILLDWTEKDELHLILTSGGTGFSSRDVTPEATRQVIEREAPGLAIAMITKSLEITPMAMLSRPVCGIRRNTLLINLPGSLKGSQECFQFIRPALPHALDLIGGVTNRVKTTHAEVQVQEHSSMHICQHGHEKAEVPESKRNREDFYKVAERARHSPFPMVLVDEAIRIVLEQALILGTERTKNLSNAYKRVLASDVYGVDPVPPFPASIKDGYAVVAADGPGERFVIGPITAGDKSDIQVKSGYVARISTGAIIPDGADAVVQVEDTVLLESSDDGSTELKIDVLSQVTVGHDIRSVGFDIKVDEQVLSAGTCIGSTELGVLATVGVTNVEVYKTPRVAVCSTGNEICEPGTPLSKGQIRDSNRISILSLLQSEGIDAIDMGIIRDSRQEVSTKFQEMLSKADVIVTSGGVSMGEKDCLKNVLQDVLDATIHFGRVFMKPGKPTTFATISHEGKTKLFFCLPGNPVSAMVTCQLFVLPALRKMAGYAKPVSSIIKAKLAFDIKLDTRPEYHRTVLSWSDEENLPVAISTGSQCSSRITSMRSANALLMLPPKRVGLERLESGYVVKAMLIGRL